MSYNTVKYFGQYAGQYLGGAFKVDMPWGKYYGDYLGGVLGGTGGTALDISANGQQKITK